MSYMPLTNEKGSIFRGRTFFICGVVDEGALFSGFSLALVQ